MKFPRHAKIFRGQLDAAPFAAVFFSLLILLTLKSSFVFTPGVSIELPAADGLPGVAGPAAVVTVDRSGQFFWENQIVDARGLRARLGTAARNASAKQSGLTLIIQADRAVAYESIVNLALLAREAGVRRVVQATRPVQFPGNAVK